MKNSQWWGVKGYSNGSGSTLFTMPSGVASPVRPHCTPRPACAAARDQTRRRLAAIAALRPGARALILFGAA